jgi:hypothetical protein
VLKFYKNNSVRKKLSLLSVTYYFFLSAVLIGVRLTYDHKNCSIIAEIIIFLILKTELQYDVNVNDINFTEVNLKLVLNIYFLKLSSSR